MEKYSVGKDEIDWGWHHIQDVDWFVYWYENGYYEGNGFAVAKRGNELELYNLGHCSCYGPLENNPFDKISIERFLEGRVTDNIPEEVSTKVLELLKG